MTRYHLLMISFAHYFHCAQSLSSHTGIAHRVLRTSSRKGRRASCIQLRQNAERILNEFYQPADFYCECISSLGGLSATTEYSINCKTHRSVHRNDIYGYIHWTAGFKGMKPMEEKACVAYYSADCEVLDDKGEIVYITVWWHFICKLVTYLLILIPDI